ncbi:hypothetical protein ACJMK2_035668, partial [Sinanodonta woodiana]
TLIEAKDGGGLTTTATLVVQVNRNLQNPEWIQTTYSTAILENYPLATSFLQLNAIDRDIQ